MGWLKKVLGLEKKKKGPSAEQRAAEKAAADAKVQLDQVNKAKDAQMAALMDIQKQALSQQAQSESNRVAQENARAAAAAKAEADRQAAAEAANITAANQKTDLLSENVTNVVAGGSAEQEAFAEVLRKRQKGATVSQALGINL